MDKKELEQEKLDLKKEQIELKEDKVYLEIKKLDFEEKKTESINSSIDTLNDLLEGFTIDAEKTILGSEPFIKPIFNESETKIIKDKIFELIKKL